MKFALSTIALALALSQAASAKPISSVATTWAETSHPPASSWTVSTKTRTRKPTAWTESPYPTTWTESPYPTTWTESPYPTTWTESPYPTTWTDSPYPTTWTDIPSPTFITTTVVTNRPATRTVTRTVTHTVTVSEPCWSSTVKPPHTGPATIPTTAPFPTTRY